DEAGGEASLDVFFGAVAGEGDGFDGPAAAHFPNEIEARAIRKADVADYDVHRIVLESLQGSGDRACGLNLVARVVEQTLHHHGGVGVILDQQNLERRGEG